MSKVKDQEKIIKTARENSYIQGNTHKTMNRYFSTKFSGQKGIAQYIQSAERKTLLTKNTIHGSRAHSEVKEREGVFQMCKS